MLAVPGHLPDDDAGWAFELKWDGVRAIAAVAAGTVTLYSRTGHDITMSYPEVQSLAAASGAADLVLDGEIVAFGGGRWPNFEALAPRMNVTSASLARQRAVSDPVVYLIFDLLFMAGESLLAEPYRRRRERLDALGLNGPAWQTPPAFIGVPGADVRAVSLRQGIEGVMAKRLDAAYQPGRRSASWRKIKNVRRQEFVVGGWNPGAGTRAGRIGSLLVGVYGTGGLHFAGRVGSGFGAASLATLAGLLDPLRRATCPFANYVPADQARGARWVEPAVVIEARFAEWTAAGRLRSAIFLGVRADKDPSGVIREPG
ncbi:MAG: non-homologous end-joining DNA ligase [Streptosporangiaceae bacterium]